jgi:hypothetical protein
MAKKKLNPWVVSFPWSCDCGYNTEVSYGQLAEGGNPICPDCDAEMKMEEDEDDGCEFVRMEEEDYD